MSLTEYMCQSVGPDLSLGAVQTGFSSYSCTELTFTWLDSQTLFTQNLLG